MNVPIVAYNTFQQFKNEPKFSAIYKKIKSELSKLTDTSDRTQFVHQQITNYVDEVLANPAAKKFITCRKGCSACCHTQVSITQDEAIFFANKIVTDLSKTTNFTLLYIQSKALNSGKEWLKIDYPLRQCIFLGPEKQCKVYEDRPMVCRTNNVLSDPELCSTEDGNRQIIKLLNTHKADMAIMAAFEISQKNGAMSKMIWETLKKININEKLKKQHSILSILD